MDWKTKFIIIGFNLDAVVCLYVWLTEPYPEARELIILHLVTYGLAFMMLVAMVVCLYFHEKISKNFKGGVV